MCVLRRLGPTMLNLLTLRRIRCPNQSVFNAHWNDTACLAPHDSKLASSLPWVRKTGKSRSRRMFRESEDYEHFADFIRTKSRYILDG
jgi:hypothetical protein